MKTYEIVNKKLWFPHSVDAVASSLFRIPQMQEMFGEGYAHDGEMKPRGIKIYPRYWPADAILERLPSSDEDVRLVLTSMDLHGQYGRINGKGYDRRAIASSDVFTDGHGVFDPDDVHFNSIAFGEIGHALGLKHHESGPSDPCEMSHNYIPGPDWSSLNDVRFCDDCYQQIR